MNNKFPILQGQTDEADEAQRNHKPYPRSVPWDLVKDHDGQAKSNHSQSLAHLAGRGGLSPKELWCVVHDTRFRDAKEITEAIAIEWLRTVEGTIWK